MKYIYKPFRIAVFLFVAMFFILSENAYSIQDISDDNAVGYGGVYLSGGKKNEDRHPLFKRNKTKLVKDLRIVMERLNEKGLPFKIIFDTDTEERKMKIEGPYSLAIVITRDDVISEKFDTPTGGIFKTDINAGLVIIIYKTDKDNEGKTRNTVLFSAPLVGYFRHIQSQRQPTEEVIDNLFIITATKTLDNHLSHRLSQLSLIAIKGVVRDIKDGRPIINIGSLAGLEEGQNIKFMKDGKKVASGVIEKLERQEGTVKISEGILPERGMVVQATNMKDQSGETYQVVQFTISSKKAASLFSAEAIGPQIAQWLSDSLADEAGKVILPTRVGGEWDQSATGESFILLTKGDEEYKFSVPKPKYSITIDLSGVASKKIEGNNVNEIWVHKVWLKVDIPRKNFSREFDAHVTKNTVPGIHSYEEKAEFYELLHQLTGKICKEAKL
jgi:hypothetical protein